MIVSFFKQFYTRYLSCELFLFFCIFLIITVYVVFNKLRYFIIFLYSHWLTSLSYHVLIHSRLSYALTFIILVVLTVYQSVWPFLGNWILSFSFFWFTTQRGQTKLRKGIVVNVCNFSKGFEIVVIDNYVAILSHILWTVQELKGDPSLFIRTYLILFKIWTLQVWFLLLSFLTTANVKSLILVILFSRWLRPKVFSRFTNYFLLLFRRSWIGLMMIIYRSTSYLGRNFMFQNYLLRYNLHWLPDVRSMDDWLAVTLDKSVSPIICPYLSRKSISGSWFSFGIYEYHALSYFTTTIFEPFFCKSTKIDRERTHLPGSDLSHRHSLAMNAFNFYFPEPSIIIRAKHKLLSDRNLPSDHHTRKYLFSIFCQCFCNMKFRIVILVLFPLLLVVIYREEIEES